MFIHSSFIPLSCAECDDSLPFSRASAIPLRYTTFPSTFFHQLFFHPPSLHLVIYILFYLSAFLFPYSYVILFWKFCFLPFSVHAQTSVIYLTLLSLLWVFLNHCINLCCDVQDRILILIVNSLKSRYVLGTIA